MKGINAISYKVLVQNSLFKSALQTLISGTLIVDYLNKNISMSWVLGLVLAMPLFAQVMQASLLRSSLKLKRTLGLGKALCLLQILAAISLSGFIFLPFLTSFIVKVTVILTSISFFSLFDTLLEVLNNLNTKFFLAKDKARAKFLNDIYANSTIASIFLGLLGGLIVYYLDLIYIYPIIWSIIIVLSMLGSLKLLKVKDTSFNEETNFFKPSFFKTLKSLFTNKYESHLFRYFFTWDLALYLSTSYFIAYMFKMLHFTVLAVIIIVTLSQLSTLITYKYASSLYSKFTNMQILLASSAMLIIEIIGWILSSSQALIKYSPILVVLNMLIFGVTIALNKVSLDRYRLNTVASTQLTNSYTLSALGAAIGTGVGGLGLDLADKLDLSFKLNAWLDFNTWDSYFLVSIFIAIISLTMLNKFKRLDK
jgi:hypothetical protein